MVRGNRIPLLNPQGIFKPSILDLPLTIRTAYQGPYEDRLGEDGLLRYHYRKGGPGQPDNVRLRETIGRKTDLIYLCGIEPGIYSASWPAHVVEDDPAEEVFFVALQDYRSWRRTIWLFPTPSTVPGSPDLPIVDFINRLFEPVSSTPITLRAGSAISDMRSCSTPLTFSATDILGVIPWFPTASPCANFTTPLTAMTSWGSDRIS